MPDSLDRRDFLKTSCALASVALAGHAVPARATESTDRKLKKAVKLSMVQGNSSLVEKFKMLKELGFDGIDIDQRVDHDDVRRARDESGLVVHGVVDYDHWKLPLSHPDPKVRAQGLEVLTTSLRDSKAYGGTTVLLVVGIVNKDISYADAWQRTQAEIRKALPLAQELGIKIAFENVWNMFLLSPLEFARYVDEFESPSVGAYFRALATSSTTAGPSSGSAFLESGFSRSTSKNTAARSATRRGRAPASTSSSARATATGRPCWPLSTTWATAVGAQPKSAAATASASPRFRDAWIRCWR